MPVLLQQVGRCWIVWGHIMLIRALGKCFDIRKAPYQFLREAKILPVEKKVSLSGEHYMM